MATQKTAVQELEEQKKRLTGLQDRRNRVSVRLDHERKVLHEAKTEAQSLFGTSDIDALRALYKKNQTDNDQVMTEFGFALDMVEQELTDIERQINFK